MTRLISESFEVSGYEEAWTESVDSGGTLDENSSLPGVPPAGLGSQCLKVIVPDEVNNNVYAYISNGDQTVTYHRAFVYISSHGLADTQAMYLFGCYKSDWSVIPAGFYLYNNAGQLQIGMSYYSNGADQFPGAVNVSVNTWYELEIYYNTVANTWTFWGNGALLATGSLTGTTADPAILFIGAVAHTGTTPTTFYLDLYDLDDTVRLGRPQGAAMNYYLMNQQ